MARLPAGASVVCIAMVLAGANRGFDISDEGLYVLLTDPLQENVAGIFNYDLFFKLVFRLAGYTFSLVELRILRLLLYLAGAWALAGFWKNISGEPKIRAELFWVSSLGLFAGYAFLPPTLSYNSLTVVLICFWLRSVSHQGMAFRRFFFVGVLLGLLVYVKVSLALLFVPLTFLLLWQKITPFHALALLLPLVLVELVFLGFLGENAFTRLAAGIPLTSQRPGYQIGLMFKSIAVGGFWVVLTGVLFFAVGGFQKTKSSYYSCTVGF